MVVKQRNIRNKPQSMAESNPNPFFRSSENTISEASEQQIVYSQVQPPNPPSMAGFYTVIISLFVFFTIAMIGMMCFVAYQLKSDNSIEVVNKETTHYQTRSSSSSKGKSNLSTKSKKPETGNTTFKKLNNECGSVVVQLAGQKGEEEWTGTGFIIYRENTPNGESLILTNLHVAQPDAESVLVVSKSGEITPAKLAGFAKDGTDLAVLAIPNMTDLEPIWKLCSSALVEEGDDVYTVGHPLGDFDFTVSSGTLSKKRFNSEKEANGAILQHTAPISPGNSGGPLLDSEGNIIGINTSLAGAGNSLFFAIPIEFLNKDGSWIWSPGYLTKIRKISIEE